MKRTSTPVEVIAHFGTDGIITPYRVKYEQDDTNVLQIIRILKRDLNTFAGNPIETYDCVAKVKNNKIYFTLNYEKKINKWFLTKL